MEGLIEMNQYRSAIIGLGQIGLMYDFDSRRERPSAHAQAYNLHPKINLVCAADNNIGQKNFLHQVAKNVEFYQDMHDMLKECPVDILSICTPASNHLSVIVSALQGVAPKIIFCEKPLVTDLTQAMQLQEILKKSNCLLIPNLSRRWNSGMGRIREHILSGMYGELQKVHVRYTRGIYNTGAHLFDLLRWWIGSIEYVGVVEKVPTSSECNGEPTFTFNFRMNNNIIGFAEAFNDEQYYMVEIDLYFSQGKIEFRNSGNDVFYYQVAEHHLFTGFKSLHLERHERNLLAEANLGNAVEHLVRVLDCVEQPICTLEDGLYPLYVADALVTSYNKNGSIEQVVLPDNMK